VELVQLGRYAISEILGRGAIGEVRAALDVIDGQALAVKLLTAEAALRPDAAEGFAREIRSVARLNHRCVVQILDQGVLDRAASTALDLPEGSPWFAMERADYSAQRPLRDWDAIHRLILDLLDSLAYCHARDLVHRDLKPGNVLRCGAHWKLADFGLAVPLHELGSNIAGTPLYMAPEQFNSPSEVGPWSDLYALGCLLWARCTGSPPFLGDVRALQDAHTRQPLPPFQPEMDLPPRFAMWLHRLLAKDPTRRFSHAADAREALLDFAPVDLPARPAPSPRTGISLIGMRELPLLGRDEPHSALMEALDRTLDRASRSLVVVEGIAGTGKSFLALHLAREAAERGRVRVLELRHPSEDAGGEGLAQFAARLLHRPRSPVSGAHRDTLTAWLDFHSPTPPLEQRLEALVAALHTLNHDRPTLLLADDLQWGAESEAFVERLLSEGPRPLFVLATERLEPGRGSVLPPHWDRIHIRGLDPDTAEALAAEVLGEASFRAMQLAEISRGSPLLAVQLAVHFAKTGRFAVQSDPIQAWKARLDSVLADQPELGSSLLVAAVLGGDVLHREWARLVPDEHALAALIRAYLAEQTPTGWRLAHPLLVDAVRDRASPGAWVRLNATVAHTLVDADPLRRARLFLAAGNPDRALELALHVHDEAHRLGDWARRRAAWRVAHACPGPGAELGLRRDLADLWHQLDDTDPDEALSRAIDLSQRADRPATWRLLMQVHIRRAEYDAAHQALQHALQLAPDSSANRRAQIQLALRSGHYDQAASLLGAPPPRGDRVESARWERTTGRIAFGQDRFDSAAEHLHTALDLAERAHAPGLAHRIRSELGEVLRWQGDLDGSVALLQQVVQQDRRHGTIGPVARLNLALAVLDGGHPQRAAALLRELQALPGVWLELDSIALAALARAEAEHGDLVAASTHIAALQRPSHDPDYRRQLEFLLPLCAYEPKLERRVEALLNEVPR